MVSIPFIAGQWSLRVGGARHARRARRVSIPFIAGQWSLQIPPGVLSILGAMFQSPSLRGSGRFVTPNYWRSHKSFGFNPLHCGAVVASGKRCSRSPFSFPGFNPLHCGAVVASSRIFPLWSLL